MSIPGDGKSNVSKIFRIWPPMVKVIVPLITVDKRILIKADYSIMRKRSKIN